MKQLVIITAIISCTGYLFGQSVGIGTSSPDSSALLELQSTDQGLLVPRMSEANRLNIADPATGLLVYQTDQTPGFYFYTGSEWTHLSAHDSDKIVDGDNDTRVLVEKTADDDIIRFDMAGTEFIRMDSGRVEFINTGSSIYLGESAGEKDNMNFTYNVGIGYRSLNKNISGSNNIAIGADALANNEDGGQNIAVGNFTMVLGGASAQGNTIIGDFSMNMNSGDYNTTVGFQSMNANTTGTKNTTLGYKANVSSGDLTNATAIGADATVGQSNSLVLGKNANVGIGTSLPSAKLHVVGVPNGSGNSEGLRIGGVDPFISLYNDGTYSGYLWHKNLDLHLGNKAAGDVLLGTDDGIKVTLKNTGRLGVGTQDPDAMLHIQTNSFGTEAGIKVSGMDGGTPNNSLLYHENGDFILRKQSVTNQLVLDTDGNVGIGTDQPTHKLHIKGGVGGLAVDGTSPRQRFLHNGTSKGYLWHNGNQFVLSNEHNGSLWLAAGDLVKMALEHTGDIGINTINPEARLHIVDNGEALRLDGNAPWISFYNGASYNGYLYHSAGNMSLINKSSGELRLGSNDATALRIFSDGDVSIGTNTSASGYKLSVNGKMIATGIRVQAQGSWPDYVFADEYVRPTLVEVRDHIAQHSHLPGFHSAQVIESEGLDFEEITVQQQEWIEVSTLYILEQDERIQRLEEQLKEQSEIIERLSSLLDNK